MSPTICTFLRIPELGRVKSRLAATIGSQQALLAYERLLLQTLSNLPASGARLELHLTPEGRVESRQFAGWLSQRLPRLIISDFVAQVSGDLGQRLSAAVGNCFAAPVAPTSVTLIGTDCPWLRPFHFTKAWEALETGADVVYGPTWDGGYYLQAQRKPYPELFADIPWSTTETLHVCKRRAADLGLRVHLLEPLEDVDEQPAWERWLATGGEGVSP
jgi:uncharacterized protein